jgi:hypothetical protein
LAKDPDFNKAGFHIGRFITAVVYTEVERADIEALRSDMYSASMRINVSSFFPCLPYRFFLDFDSTPFPEYHQTLSIQGSVSQGYSEETHQNANPQGRIERTG